MYNEKVLIKKIEYLSGRVVMIHMNETASVGSYYGEYKNFYFQLLFWLQAHYGYKVKIDVDGLLVEMQKIKEGSTLEIQAYLKLAEMV